MCIEISLGYTRQYRKNQVFSYPGPGTGGVPTSQTVHGEWPASPGDVVGMPPGTVGADHQDVPAQPARPSAPRTRDEGDVLRANGTIVAMTNATLVTNHGDIGIELFDADSPKTVENFLKLSRDGFYNGVVFHRVIENFMIQGGDPTGTGMGGPGYQFEDEINKHPVERGALAMANSGPNTNGSQFFIVTADACPWLDGLHTVFGRVTSGMDVVNTIGTIDTDMQDRPLSEVRIESVTVGDAG